MAAHGDRVRLPLLSGIPHGRQALTCRYRCGDACRHEPPNPTENPSFGEVIARTVTRRGFLRAGAVLSLAAGGITACDSSPAGPSAPSSGSPSPRGLNFVPVQPNTEDALRVPQGYRHSVVVRWGDPILPGGPAFDFDNQTAGAQAVQFGYNNDFTGLVPIGEGRWLMVCNHEYSTEPLMFRGYDPDNPTEAQVRIGLAAHGLSVLAIERDSGGVLRPGPDPRFNRRITATSQLELTGPAAGSPLLRTAADPTGARVLGTLNNCAGGVTPWGTVLSGEENFNQYFANAALVTDPVAKQRLARYGVEEMATERKWERFDTRFDVSQEPNEPHRFGWVVELDPHDPTAPAIKHTALGRFKHEGATIRVAPDGQVVVYMGDDERFDYVYKFVSDGRMVPGSGPQQRAQNRQLLDSGTLYVAKFTGNSPPAQIDGSGRLPADGAFDGAGEWMPLARNRESFVSGMSAEEVYVFTRIAGDRVGATKMDRPEDVQPHPRTGRVYLAMTNNDERGVDDGAAPDEANPRRNNKHGHVIELAEGGDDPTGTRFGWRVLLLCGDPADPSTYFAGFDKSQVSPISCPDNLAFDWYGNLWISTDGNELGFNDGLYGVALQGEQRGLVKLFATVPVGAEACGPVIDEQFVLVSPQPPGDSDDASPDNPASRWPDGGSAQPRPSVAVVYRDGGGPIGF